jgi:hypothetical protein
VHQVAVAVAVATADPETEQEEGNSTMHIEVLIPSAKTKEGNMHL